MAFTEGQRVSIKVNPQNPSQYYIEADRTAGGYIAVIIGIVFAGMSVLFSIF